MADGDTGGNTVLKIATICLARDLWKFNRSCKQMHLLCSLDPWNLRGTALLSGFQSSRGDVKSTEWNNIQQM